VALHFEAKVAVMTGAVKAEMECSVAHV